MFQTCPGNWEVYNYVYTKMYGLLLEYTYNLYCIGTIYIETKHKMLKLVSNYN